MLRRGGRLSRHEPANLSHLTNLLREAESQYARSHRAVEGNRLVRRWRPHGRDENDPGLINIEGNWYARTNLFITERSRPTDTCVGTPNCRSASLPKRCKSTSTCSVRIGIRS
jgi:hypothetical protein